MKFHVYYSKAGCESAEKLAGEIIKLVGKDKVLTHSQKDPVFERDPKDICVNWGASTATRFSADKSVWLNRRLVTNKLKMLHLFTENDVPTVTYLPVMPGKKDGWYARKVEHTDGDDLGAKLNVGDFYVKHVDTAKEFRVHVFKGKIIRASLKVALDEKAKLPFRTGDHWGFSSQDYSAALGHGKQAAINAVEALGYDFGGVDVALTSTGHPVVFEVNSAPWLGGDAARKYAKAIVALA